MRPSLPDVTTMPPEERSPQPARRSDNLLALVRDAAVISWTLDPLGNLLEGGEWAALTGQTAGDAAGDGWLAVIHPDDRDRTGAAWSIAFANARHYNFDCRIRSRDGTYGWYNMRVTPMRGRDATVERWIGVCLEIPGTWRFGDEMADVASAMIGAPLVRAARAMLDWSAADLSDRAGLSVSTIRRLENDACEIQSRRTSTARLLAVFQQAGLRFVDHDGTVVAVGWADPAAC